MKNQRKTNWCESTKSIRTSFAFLLICTFAHLHICTFAQNTWTKKADFKGKDRADAFAFSIGSKGYVGGGYGILTNTNGGYEKDCWEFDPIVNTWTQKADFGGGARYGAATFSIGTKGYIAAGNNGGSVQDDLWEYDQTTNKWTQKAAMPDDTINNTLYANSRDFPVGFAIAPTKKAYIGLGWQGTDKKDFWEYNITANKWSKKADFPGGIREKAVAFAIGDKGYVGTGWDETTYYKDFYEYDPATNKWTKKADLPGVSRKNAVGFSIGNRGYIGTGTTATSNLNDFYEYNPFTNQWTQKANMQGEYGQGTRHAAVGFPIDNKGYIGTGDWTYAESDFWEYTPDGANAVAETLLDLRFTIYNLQFGEKRIAYNISDNAELVFFDITGRKVISYFLSAGENTLTISTAAWKEGIYIYQLLNKTNTKLTSGKIVIAD